MNDSTPLPLDSAVALMHGWCSWQFRARDLRALFIKGPVLAAQNLRLPRASSDVDVLVHPDDYESARRLLGENGWSARPAAFAGRFYDDHSTSFIHPQWPCDIDVHSRYPGLLGPSDAVFERLWTDRTSLRLAEIECWVCSRPANALIMGLHALRGAAPGSRHEQELDYLTHDVEFSPEELQEVADIAAVTGSSDSAAFFLSALHAPASREQGSVVDRAALVDWQTRTDAADTPVWVWLNAFRSAPPRLRSVVLWRAVWPTRRDLEVDGIPNIDTRRQRVRFRLSRLARGIPAAARLVWRRVSLSRSAPH